MNRQHLWAFLWLRWRLLVNSLRRGGTFNLILTLIFAAVGVLVSAGAFVTFFFVGLLLLGDASPTVLLYVWAGLIVLFGAWWTTGTLIELQRADALSLDKVLHFPISVRGAFFLNYVSSLFSFTIALFVPSMLALAIGLAASRGAAMLLLLPAIVGFLLMVTAVTYQFQGWLASLMANKRRRRTILVIVTACFILFCQIPNILNMLHPWQETPSHAVNPSGPDEDEEAAREEIERLEPAVRLASTVLPVGWLAISAEKLAQGNFLVPMFVTGGMLLIGSLSLGRSYRTTMRLYTGYFSSRQAPRATTPEADTPPRVVVAGAPSVAPGTSLLEWRLPFIPDRAAAVAVAAFRCLLRAPEIKLAMLGQIILLVIVGTANLGRTSSDLPELVRPLLAAGCMMFVLVSMINVVGNQFGLDRNGFRAYVLSAVPRRDILLGKNLAAMPLALTLPALALVVIQMVRPMRVDHFFAVLPHMVTIYLLFCMLANWISILAPTRLRSGTLRSARPRALTFLLQFAFLLLLPWSLSPAFVPLLIEFLLTRFAGLDSRLPIYLVLSIVECAVVMFLYRWCLHLQGPVLQNREAGILETVCVREE